MSNFSCYVCQHQPSFFHFHLHNTLLNSLCYRTPYHIRVFQPLHHIATSVRSLLRKQWTSEKQHKTATLTRNLTRRWYEYSVSSTGSYIVGVLPRPKFWCQWNTTTNKKQCCPWPCHRATRGSVVMAPLISHLWTRWSNQLHTQTALPPGQKPGTPLRGSWMGPTTSVDSYEKRGKKALVPARYVSLGHSCP